MPQVSKRPLAKNIQQNLYSIFWQTLADLKSSADVKEFLTDLLTPTEKVMLAKRLAIALMLIKGYDYSSIRSTLKVSPQTIGAVSLWLKYSGSGYRKSIERIIKKQKIAGLIQNVENLLREIRPERTFTKVTQKGFPKGKFQTPI